MWKNYRCWEAQVCSSRPGPKGLNGQKLARNASPLVWHGGPKAVADCFTLEVDRSSQNFFEPFFDPEEKLPGGRHPPLIENGVFRRGYADKKCAWEQHMEPTAAASGAYDDVPALALPSLSVRPTGKTLRNFWMAARPCTSLTSGGDITPDGSFATRCRWPISTKTAAWWAGCRSSASGVT